MPVFSKDDLEAKVLPDVKKIAKKLDIKNYSKLKKAEIIALILKHPFNKSGSAELVIVSPKKSQPKKVAKKKSTPKKKVAKKKSTPKKKKTSPKKKSPGFFDKVKEFFSPTTSEPKKAKKAAKKKKTPVKEPKVQKVKSSPKPKKVAKAVEKKAGKRTPTKRRPRKTKAEKEQEIVNALKNKPKLKEPIVVKQLDKSGNWEPINQIAPKALPEPVKVLKLKSRSKSPAKAKPLVVKEKTIKVTPKKAKVKTIKKLDINLPSGEKASVLEIPALPKFQNRASPGSILKNVKQEIKNVDQSKYFKVGAPNQPKKKTAVVKKKSSQAKVKTVQKRQKRSATRSATRSASS